MVPIIKGPLSHLSMFGVIAVVFPKQPMSPMPRSSANNTTIFGFLAAITSRAMGQMRKRKPIKREPLLLHLPVENNILKND